MIFAAVAIGAGLAAVTLRQDAGALTMTLVALALTATVGAGRVRAVASFAACLWGGTYLLALSASGGSFDLLAPVFGIGILLLLEVLHSSPAGLSVSTDVRLRRAVYVLGAIGLGGGTAVAAAWAGGNARVAGPVAFAVATAIGLAIIGATVVLTSSSKARS